MASITPLEDSHVPEDRDNGPSLLESLESAHESPCAARRPSGDDESGDDVFASIPRTSVFRIGDSLPPFSQGTLAAFGRSKSHSRQLDIAKRGMKVVHGEMPDHLHVDLNHQEWGNNDKLKKYFPLVNETTNRPVKKRFLNFPLCLLGLCATSNDRLIALNAWLQMKKDDQTTFNELLKQAFTFPTKLDGMLKEDVKKPIYIGILDPLQDRQESLKNSASQQVLEYATAKRKSSDLPHTVSQMNDQHVHAAKQKA